LRSPSGSPADSSSLQQARPEKDAALAQHDRSSSRRAGIVARGRYGYKLGVGERLGLLQMVATGGGMIVVESVLPEEYKKEVKDSGLEVFQPSLRCSPTPSPVALALLYVMTNSKHEPTPSPVTRKKNATIFFSGPVRESAHFLSSAKCEAAATGRSDLTSRCSGSDQARRTADYFLGVHSQGLLCC